jgi:hypothetical protein
MSDNNKLVHDINSSISAISQSLTLINKSWKDSPQVLEEILPLLIEKMTALEDDWIIAKNIIKNKG